MRREYVLTDDQVKKLIGSMKGPPLITLQCGQPESVQERANRAWIEVGLEAGFDGMTTRPVHGKPMQYITAEPLKHDLYTEKDDDAPSSIKDRNDEIVLGLCKRCGQGEGDLEEFCPGRKKR